MSSLVAIHVEDCQDEALLRATAEWLAGFGFGNCEPYQVVPTALEIFHLGKADAVAMERLNDRWHILLTNAFNLGGRPVDEAALAPLAARLGNRVVLFVAQTTSSVYDLTVFDAGKCVRSLVTSDGRLLRNDGPPLPGERPGVFQAASAADDEDPPSEEEDATSICAALGFELWRNPPLRGPGHWWRRRGFFSKLLGQ